jgi:hypothetical protein
MKLINEEGGRLHSFATLEHQVNVTTRKKKILFRICALEYTVLFLLDLGVI